RPSYESAARGGLFTQAFVEGLRDDRNIDVARGAVTLGLAFQHASGPVYAQRPRIKGNLDTLPLAWPKLAAAPASLERRAGVAADNRVKWTLLTPRQAVARGREISGRQLLVDVFFGHRADDVSIGVYNLADTPPRAHPEAHFHQDGGWQAGESKPFVVPLSEVLPGKYRVEVLPCRDGQCDHPSKFEIEISR